MGKGQGKTTRALWTKKMTGKERLHWLADTFNEDEAAAVVRFLQSIYRVKLERRGTERTIKVQAEG